MSPIKNIEIKNFKSIRHQRIDDCKRINVFIGYPNVGKSNILEALSLFAVNEQTDLKDLIRVQETPTIFFNGFIESDLMISLNDEYGVFGGFKNDIFFLRFQIKREDGIFLKEMLNPTLNSSVINQLQFKDFESNGKQIFNESDFNKKVAANFVIKKYEFQKKIQKDNKRYSSLEYPFGNNIFSVLQTNKILNDDAKELFVDYNLDFVYDSRMREFTILKRTEAGVFTVPYELVADTLQRLIFHKAAILSNKEKILLFEEPEAHMFPPYIAKFTSDVIFDENKNQYFISTHSPFVINDFMEELKEDELSIYAVGYKKETGETLIRKFADEQITEIYQYGVDVFFNLEDYLKDVVA